MNRLPSDDEILAFLRDNPGQSGKREIARAFGLKGAAKVELKQTLARLARDGAIEKRRRHVRPAGALPPVLVLRVTGPDAAGDLWAEPAEWEADAPAPRILVRTRRDDPALGAGDRLLGRLLDGEETLTARVIRRIGMGPRRVLGIFHDTAEGGRIAAIDKKTDRDWLVARGDAGGARDGELVEAEQTGPARGHGLPRARVVARLGDPSAPRSVSLIAIHEHGIPDAFPEDALTDAAAAKPIRALGNREDLRALPFVTIDPSDARDHDDAVFAHPDDDARQPRRPRRLGRHRRRRPLRHPRLRPRPRGPPPRQLHLLPRPRRPDAARPPLRRPLLARRRPRPPRDRRPPDPRRRRPGPRPPLHPGADPLGRHPHLLPGPGRRRRHAPTPPPRRSSTPSSPRSGPHGQRRTRRATCASR